MLKIQMLEQLVTSENTGRQHQSNTTWHGSPVAGAKSPQAKQTPERLKGTTHDMFELLVKVQGSRIDDQRCMLPAYFNQTPSAQRQLSHSPSEKDGSLHSKEDRLSTNNNAKISPSPTPATLHTPPPASPQQPTTLSKRLLQEVLARPGPYPMIVVPPRGGYWVDGTDHKEEYDRRGEPLVPEQSWRAKIETDDTAKFYRRFFVGREHSSLVGNDEHMGPVLLSIKTENVDNQEHTRILLRLRSGTMHEIVPSSRLGDDPTPAKMARLLNDQLNVENFTPVMHPKISQFIAAEYDDKLLVADLKFGVLYQQYGQVDEEELFCNNVTTPAFDDFLSLLGQRIQLKDHKGYTAGLDKNGHTGDTAVFEVFKERNIMFHVSTLLPYTENDPQQLQRKRHIGNDIVAIVFQEENTPFTPDMIASHFLHTFIVVQVIDPNTPNTRYKVSVTARDDVPFFGPTLPTPAIFRHGPGFKEFLLTKLINAENACYKADQFAKLQLRTRTSLLQSLVDKLKQKTAEFLRGGASASPGTPKGDSGPGSRFFDTVKKALGVKQSQSVDNNLGSGGHERLSKKGSQVTIPESTPSSGRSTSKSSIHTTSSSHHRSSKKSPTNNNNNHLHHKRNGSSSSTASSSPDLTAPVSHRMHLCPGQQPCSDDAASDDASSLTSEDLDHLAEGGVAGGGVGAGYADSDTGLESMSSAETAASGKAGCSVCRAELQQQQVEGPGVPSTDQLMQEVTRLKCDKLDLLRQNVNCQRDIKRLREKELSLQGDLSVATKEIIRLRELLKDYSPNGDRSPM